MGNVESDMESSPKEFQDSERATLPFQGGDTRFLHLSQPTACRRCPLAEGAGSRGRIVESEVRWAEGVHDRRPAGLGISFHPPGPRRPGVVPIFHGFRQDDTDASALALLSGLKSNPPDRFSRAHLRILQRRVQQ